jgi:predicted nucleic acid-binding protein
MLYLDTSLVVALLTPEAHSDRADRWLAANASSGLAVSDWVVAELAAAFAAKVRLGRIDAVMRDEALHAFEEMRRSGFLSLAVGEHHFLLAARLASYPDAKLRAGDALHLAVSSHSSATICTLDEGLAEAAAYLRLPVELV